MIVYDTQSGITGMVMRWCWEFGYKHDNKNR